MGETLNVASEKGGYTLADRGTLLARGKVRPLALEILVEGEPTLLNVYHVIEVNSARWPKVNVAGAKAFADFVVSKQGQDSSGSSGSTSSVRRSSRRTRGSRPRRSGSRGAL